MIVTIHLTPEDLSNLRFGYSPLMELSASFHMLFVPHKQAGYQRWIEETQRALHDVELPYLSALIPGESYIPDFLTPNPISTQMTIEDEIERMLALPDDLIRQNVQTLIDLTGDSEIRRYFITYPREMLLCLADDLRLYWQRTLAHHWSYLNGVLEGDVLYRARRLALDGVTGLFEDLHPFLHYQSNLLEIREPHKTEWRDREHSFNGEGMQFVPAVFACSSVMWQIEDDWQPMIVYTPRGIGQWKQKPAEPDQSLEIALGTGRARVLSALAMPLTTTELGRQLDLTSGAVSQHLSRLQQAGLVTPHRSGKRVFYHLTARGEQLLGLFGGV